MNGANCAWILEYRWWAHSSGCIRILFNPLFLVLLPAVSPAPVSTSIPVLPVILEHPQDVYVVRSQSVDLTCTAQPASQVYFSCNGELISPEQLSHDQTFDEYKENKMIKARLSKSAGNN